MVLSDLRHLFWNNQIWDNSYHGFSKKKKFKKATTDLTILQIAKSILSYLQSFVKLISWLPQNHYTPDN